MERTDCDESRRRIRGDAEGAGDVAAADRQLKSIDHGVEDRLGRGKLSVRLRQAFRCSNRRLVGVDRADEQTRSCFIAWRDLRGEQESDEAGDPRCQQQGPPPAADELQVCREFQGRSTPQGLAQPGPPREQHRLNREPRRIGPRCGLRKYGCLRRRGFVAHGQRCFARRQGTNAAQLPTCARNRVGPVSCPTLTRRRRSQSRRRRSFTPRRVVNAAS
jgi:hypothetical protein